MCDSSGGLASRCSITRICSSLPWICVQVDCNQTAEGPGRLEAGKRGGGARKHARAIRFLYVLDGACSQDLQKLLSLLPASRISVIHVAGQRKKWQGRRETEDREILGNEGSGQYQKSSKRRASMYHKL